MLKKFITPFRYLLKGSYQFRKPVIQSMGIMRNFSTQKTPDDPMAKLKEQSQQFYNEQISNIIELQSVQAWQNIVTNAKEPLIVDLYADWCEPCKILTPKLQKRVSETKNVKLIKVNIDKHPQISQALQVKSVPTVYLIYGKQAIDGFQGAVADAELDRFFESIKRVQQMSLGESQAVTKLDKSRSLIEEGNIEGAIQELESFPQKNVQKDIIAVKQIFLAQCYLSAKKIAKFKQTMGKVQSYLELYQQNEHLLQLYNILKNGLEQMISQSKQNPEILAIKQKIQTEKSLQSIFELAEAYKKFQMIEESLEVALDIVKENKNWQEKKANKFILAIFKELGNTSPVTQKYRKIFQRLLN